MCPQWSTTPGDFTHWIRLQSSVLAAARYHRSSRLLQLAFRSGSIYQYTGVPPHTFAELPEAESKGEYFNRYIRNCFPVTPLPSSLFNC
jgi:hypothetical protein